MNHSSSKKREREEEIFIDDTRSRLRSIAEGDFRIAPKGRIKTDAFDDDRDDLVEYEDEDVSKKQGKGAAYEDDNADDDDDEEGDDGEGRDYESDEDNDGNSGANRGRHIRKIRGEDAGPIVEADEKGVTIEPFNLRGEREQGYYDASGDYTWKKSSKDEEEEEKDAWLDELDEMDPALRRKLQADVEAAHARKLVKEGKSSLSSAFAQRGVKGGGGDEDDEDEADDIEEGDRLGGKDAPLFGDGDSDVSAGPAARCAYLQVLCDTLRDGETAAAALRRLGAGAKKRSWQKVDESVPKQSAEDLLAFNALTDALDGLVNDGLVDAYTLTRALAKSELRQSQAETKD
jgi:hypothetical protein